ncbi:MAG: hypothetical protein LBH46_00740 [Rickettsiales bacterium]|jgi:hypothetical protein|nr:hypothetical protein [Rickettsiales bacterium]
MTYLIKKNKKRIIQEFKSDKAREDRVLQGLSEVKLTYSDGFKEFLKIINKQIEESK